MSDKSVPRKLQMKSNHTVLFVNTPQGYEAAIGPLPGLEQHVGPAGMLRVTYRKGTAGAATDIDRDSIHAYARSVGMQAVAPVAVDDDWSALRLKII